MNHETHEPEDIEARIAEIKELLVTARYSSSILEQKLIDDCEWLVAQRKACREENKEACEKLLRIGIKTVEDVKQETIQDTKAVVEEALYDTIAYALGPDLWDTAKQAIAVAGKEKP